MYVGILPKGYDFDSLPKVYAIFITENDVLKRGGAFSRIERRLPRVRAYFWASR